MTAPPPPAPHPAALDGGRVRRRMPTAILVLGLLSVALLITVWRLGDAWTSRDLRLLHVSADIHNLLTDVHLGVQKLDEARLDPGAAELGIADVRQSLTEARQLARALIEGDDGELTRQGFRPSPEPEVAAELADLRILVERFSHLTNLRLQRLQVGEPTLPHSPTGIEYENVFSRLEEHSGNLQRMLAGRILDNKRRSMWAIGGILAGWLLIISGAAWALWHREKQRFRAEEALREREGQLLQAQKMEAVGRLAGGIAHDINNYLAAIRGQCELVKMKTPAEDPTRRRMDLVLTTSDRASSLIERLLAFSRRQPVERRVVDLNAVVTDLQPMMERLIGADLRLRTRPCSQRCTLHVDPSQIEQVIVNLLINAREAMPRGGDVRLTCACHHFAEDDPARPPVLPPGDYVELRVEDTGHGIEPEMRDRIFEPFFTTKEEASGLGLPTVYGIVQQNGGTITVESQPGEGTTFRVLLPRHGSPEAAAEVLDETHGEVPRGHGERVLVVDDHPEFRDSMHGLLGGWGYEVETAADAAEAERLFADARDAFDLVITDVVMPGGNGPALMRRLRDRHGPVPALYVSGYTGDVALRHDTAGEVVDLLHKPFRFEVLARKVREMLDRPALLPPSVVGEDAGVVGTRVAGVDGPDDL